MLLDAALRVGDHGVLESVDAAAGLFDLDRLRHVLKDLRPMRKRVDRLAAGLRKVLGTALRGSFVLYASVCCVDFMSFLRSYIR